MPLRIERSALAKHDLFEIWDHIFPNSQKGATRVLGDIYAAFSMLAEHPQAGRARPELGTELRSYPVAGHIVFYRNSASVLEIIRILHAARDIGPDLLSE
jgi:toxin ParE1/3/4